MPGSEMIVILLTLMEPERELRRRMGTSRKDEYVRLERASNEARVKSEQARLALEQHIAAHHC